MTKPDMDYPSPSRMVAGGILAIGAVAAVLLAAGGEPWSAAVIFLVAVCLSGAVIYTSKD